MIYKYVFMQSITNNTGHITVSNEHVSCKTPLYQNWSFAAFLLLFVRCEVYMLVDTKFKTK